MKRYKALWMLIGLFLCLAISGCGNSNEEAGFVDGYYTAIMSDYSFGWKEYVTICVMDNKIVSVEYNARNKAGFIKSWDSAYMRNMNSVSGTYPNRYTRDYAAQLLETQGMAEIDMLAGASSSGGNFQKMTAALLESAQIGDTEIQIVQSPEPEE
ncbi:MAG: FMN-binding protein [Lachnospiraceae bacterium]|nr:FMN-binding protein [Lachnospiraceae bacterium]